MRESDPLTAQLRALVREAVAEALEEAATSGTLGARPGPAPVEDATWRVRLWTCHPETRLNVDELAEALGRPKSAVYKLTAGGDIPHRKDLSGGLVFMAGQIRAWLRDNETPVIEGESWTPGENRRPYLKAS